MTMQTMASPGGQNSGRGLVQPRFKNFAINLKQSLQANNDHTSKLKSLKLKSQLNATQKSVSKKIFHRVGKYLGLEIVEG